MSNVKAPRSLRFDAAIGSADDTSYSATKVSAVASLIAVASFSGAEAQQSSLPPVNVDAPVARPRHVTSKPTSDQVRARNALRRAARRSNQQAQQAPVPFPNAGGLPADRDRYADPAAPYKGDRLQASGKYPEPILNTPKSVTVLTKDVLEDKNATSLKSAILSTAGVTLGTGEGGNAFGDRFFIRGFDARNDIFIDGVRDAGVSVRENFFTEQVEILRGPGSSFAGRGTTGGAINIVTKQATTENSFYNMDTSFGTDRTKRVTLDVNQVISPTLAIRAGGLFQDAGVAGRNYVTDNRDGAFVAGTWKPVDAVKISGNYIHTELTGIPGLRRAVLPAEHCDHGRWPVPGLRRQPQQLLRLRQSRLLQDRAGYRHDQRRGADHAGPDDQQQDPGIAFDPELHRHAGGIAGAHEPALGVDI
ncbi:outer membrane receptor protein involved in Fe transport [Bradyrhizobium sp. JR6.1]